MARQSALRVHYRVYRPYDEVNRGLQNRHRWSLNLSNITQVFSLGRAKIAAEALASEAYPTMNYRNFFRDAIDQLQSERRYRVFAEIERDARRFPHALRRREQ